MAFPKPRYAALTDVGVKRSHNQDACAAQPAGDEARFTQIGHLFIVADGMGGHAVGEKASAMAVRGIPLTFQKYVKQEGVVPAIRRAFKETNAEIFDIGTNTPEFKGLGTTGTALILRPEGAWIGHVGDSRIYRIRPGLVEQLTFDHSWVWEIARRQGIDPDELGDFKKNVIVRSLGPDAEVLADIEGPHPVEPGDIFLICSDGLSNQVTADELGAVATTMPPDEAAKFLIALSNLRGGPDNITAVIVQVPGAATAQAAALPKKKKSPFAGVVKLFKAVDKRVPWSYSTLGLGMLLAIGSFLMRSEKIGGAGALFAVASLFILAGVIGLVLHIRKIGMKQNANPEPDGAGELRTYKTYKFAINDDLVNRIVEVEVGLAESLKEHGGDGVDWKAHKKWSDEATAKATKADLAGVFKAKCKAVTVLAAAWNTDRSKVEAFAPNYTPR